MNSQIEQTVLAVEGCRGPPEAKKHLKILQKHLAKPQLIRFSTSLLQKYRVKRKIFFMQSRIQNISIINILALGQLALLLRRQAL